MDDVAVCIAGDRVPQTDSYKYPGSVIQSNGDINLDVTHHVRAGPVKWMAATRALCDKNVPLKLKCKFYRLTVNSHF